MEKLYDCGFTKENNWFRYRAAAIIIEDLEQYKAFSGFLKDYLSREHMGIEHIVTDERK